MRFFYFYCMTIENIYRLFKKYPIACTDSREPVPGSLFFALKGDKFDGNLYASDALSKGAAYAIIDKPECQHGNNYILVNDVLDTFQRLANHHRRQLGIPIIAITGTNGKTTTKELFASVLSKKYTINATKGNLNNHIGVPKTLLSMDDSTEIGIVEMGANHIGEIEILCNIAEPNYGVITNIGKAHLEGFGSYKGIIKAKTELYKYLEKSHGTIFYNADDTLLKNIVNNLKCKSVTYGTIKEATIQGKLMSSDPYLTVFLSCSNNNRGSNKYIVKTNLVGEYNLENVMAAVCLGMYFDISIDDIIAAIAEYLPSNNRSQLVKKGNNKLLLDCYNANPDSMEAAIKNFSKSSGNGRKKVLILGEMLELGKDSKKEHLKIIKLIESLDLNDVILVGQGFRSVGSHSFQYFDNSELLSEYLRTHKIEKAFILIKGSRGVKMEKILENF